MRVFFWRLPSQRLRRGLLAAVLGLTLVGLAFYSLQGVRELLPASTGRTNPVFQVDTPKPLVALTVNVAWGEEYLPDLLAALKAGEAKATFFMVGDWVRQFPALTKDIAAGGHELGNHTWYHPHPTQISEAELKEELQRTADLLEKLTQKKPALFAPPYGEWDERVVSTAGELGYPTIMWSLDTVDWERPPAEVIVERVLAGIQPGGIVLMHPTQPTVEALPQILKGLKKKGLQPVTVSELLAAGR
ncbi:MAG TPA: polysaccharide deacetylase family protein [Firmicutes bacterium]|uniref:polysaccharide deacetylase family protein n=1 Tax=Gelria sp. Kuro-4 TaxID=2796927 RepID=UPI0019C305F5|nr:polysaccharide deacetylase family protein [Gelria sp. Kuro-4]BCV23937.1 polysaccharide deacetylase [Gelria sp. Kuro-4]HHV58676.1 polysaccharide deacetylase family protein [Bacillota bacterium]